MLSIKKKRYLQPTVGSCEFIGSKAAIFILQSMSGNTFFVLHKILKGMNAKYQEGKLLITVIQNK